MKNSPGSNAPDPKAPASADESSAAPSGKRGAFSRPTTPTTPFMPGNPVHDALMKQAEQRASGQMPAQQQSQQPSSVPSQPSQSNASPFPQQSHPPIGYGANPAYSQMPTQQQQQMRQSPPAMPSANPQTLHGQEIGRAHV